MGVLVASFDVDRHAPPEYYGRRIGAPGVGRTHGFTDPAAALGAGVNVQIARHVSVRPEVEAIVAWRDGRSFIVTGAAVQLAYHFERHVVTPAAGGR
jgi:hypothetical protein